MKLGKDHTAKIAAYQMALCDKLASMILSTMIASAAGTFVPTGGDEMVSGPAEGGVDNATEAMSLAASWFGASGEGEEADDNVGGSGSGNDKTTITIHAGFFIVVFSITGIGI